jgi:hypothetical protein
MLSAGGLAWAEASSDAVALRVGDLEVAARLRDDG